MLYYSKHLWCFLVLILCSCRSSTDCVSERRVLSLEQTLSHLAQGHFSPANTPYLDSLGEELNAELKVRYNRNQLTGLYYVDCEGLPLEVRLQALTDDKIIDECLIRAHREVAAEPFLVRTVGCDTIWPTLKVALDRDQSLRKKDTSTKDLLQADQANHQLVMAAIESCGWHVFEEEDFDRIALVLLHSEPRIMAYYYLQLEAFHKDGLISGLHYARLTDRILMYSGFPQIYGTQRAGKSFHEIRDIERVDELRANLGLDSLENYAAKHGIEL